MNSLGVIARYKYEGMWVFDDEAVGLVREPFVSGIDSMIDRLVDGVPDAEKGFRFIFQPRLFPATLSSLSGGARSMAVIGITRLSSIWRFGPCLVLFKYFEERSTTAIWSRRGKERIDGGALFAC